MPVPPALIYAGSMILGEVLSNKREAKQLALQRKQEAEQFKISYAIDPVVAKRHVDTINNNKVKGDY